MLYAFKGVVILMLYGEYKQEAPLPQR